MKHRVIFLTAVFSGILFLIMGISVWAERKNDTEDVRAEQIVAVNEIRQLARLKEYDRLEEKTQELEESIRSTQPVADSRKQIFLVCGICFLFLLLIFGYVYFSILRPFDKMKQFAHKIAQGNFEVSLDYERSNYFGEFTWAFDSMRQEITKARACEREAIENNKTVIATLSHDIKTPLSSIRAYAEGLEANMDGTPQKRQKYLSVIMRKCDEVSSLTNDLFLHSLSDLDKLKMESEEFEICKFLEDVVGEIVVEQSEVRYLKPDFMAVVSADRKRLTQVAENLINNAKKYAKSEVEVSVTRSDGCVEIRFRDYGDGICDEDMPFVFDKFYRGKNCGEEQGSGLGLYIVKYIAEQMSGQILLHNHVDGLEAILRLPVLSEFS